ncbi:uncharacterized mitochondrial protein AtMg00810-like [Phoenix dactylifera]|uniref:Uncharacterized mitochondrial protein AtMg00810-like n=1 Tax=Phoenix dactylifera TaxID=42345 RepID=A0A8B7MSU8_PHODC|nr:uncharacterized mitochondrial protein AtMg00810-like [Phoenix dactylifera]
MLDCKPITTPLSVKPHSTKELEPFPNPEYFRSLAGSLQYLTITRPDISFAVNYICQFMHRPLQTHYEMLKRILQYIKGTVNHFLHYNSGSLTLSTFCDSDWARDASDRRSTTGYCVFLGSNLISWLAKKQPTVARSSTEAEYRALAITSTEIIWLRRLLKELLIPISEPTELCCDNISALSLATNPVFHARTKHIEVDYHFVREKVQSKELRLARISTQDQPADIFTKPLSGQRHSLLCSKLRVLSQNSA